MMKVYYYVESPRSTVAHMVFSPDWFASTDTIIALCGTKTPLFLCTTPDGDYRDPCRMCKDSKRASMSLCEICGESGPLLKTMIELAE